MRSDSLVLMICGVALVAGLFVASPVPASQARDFQWTAQLSGEVRSSEPARVPLPATVIAKLQPGSTDLRLFDSYGQEAPYVIYEDIAPAALEKTFPLSVKEFHELESADQFIVEKPQRSEIIDSIEVQTSTRDFKRNVRVEGSPDGQSWSPLTEDAIFDYSSRVTLRKTIISLPSTDAQFFRVTISKDTTPPGETGQVQLQYRDLVFSTNGTQTPPFRVDSFNAHSGEGKQDSHIEDKVTLTQLKISYQDKGTSRIDLGGLHLPLNTICFDIADPFFFRPVEIQVSDTGQQDSYNTFFTGVIHRIPGAAQGGLTLAGGMDKAPFVRLLVRDGDNPPLRIQSVTLTWNRRVLYFYPRHSETYSLCFGHNEMLPPDYETAQLIKNDAVKLRNYIEWKVGPILVNPDYSPSWGKAEREEFQGWILNTLVVAILVGLGIWGVTILKRLPKSA